MNLQQIARLALQILFFGFFTTVTAQTNQPFTWKQTTDPWYKANSYTFKYATNDAPAYNGTNNRGPVCTNDCNDSTAPGICTENLMKEKFKEVELPGINFPRGYSGVEYVTFEVQINGRIYGYQVVKQPVVCPPCVQTAVNQVASLGEWQPAVQNGIFVKSTVVVPVYFKK